MEELLNFAKALSAAGGTVLAFVFIFGSRTGWFLWKREVDKTDQLWQDRLSTSEAKWIERLKQEQQDKTEWKAMCLKTLGITETVAKSTQNGQ